MSFYSESWFPNVNIHPTLKTTHKAYIIKKIEAKAKSTIYGYNLINEGDVILVGISGGKDSFALLDILKNLRFSLREKFQIEACHVRANDMPYRADEEFMQKYCIENEIPLHFENITVEYQPDGRHPACFICSWKRRKALFKLARTRRCNKIAFGHHLEDAVDTLLLNMVHHSSISSLPPILGMFNGEIHIVRPLINAHEHELKKYCEVLGFPSEISLCPHDDKTTRNAIRGITQLANKLNRSGTQNIFRSMGTICDDYIVHKPNKNGDKKVSDNHLNIS